MTVPQSPVSWRKATRSQTQGACAEVRNDLAAIRDSKNPDGPTIDLPMAGLVRLAKNVR